jgi:FkbM family methyltransferase
MHKVGTNYGGWFIPKNISLNRDSVVISGGVGEDVSFDIKIQSKYGCYVYLIDPTEKSVVHYEECKKYYESGKTYKFKGNIQPDYYTEIENECPDFEKLLYINKGIWSHKDELKFFRQHNPDYVSQTVIENFFTEQYDCIVPVDSLKNIMEENNIKKIDLMKLNIEGSEIKVLDQMLNDNIFPTFLIISFDLAMKNKDPEDLTGKMIKRLENHDYVIIYDDKHHNLTFERKV